MKRFVVGMTLVMWLAMSPMAEAGVGGAVKNVWTYLTGFVTCGIARAGALVDWVIETGTCALTTVNKNPVNLQPIITTVPSEVPNG